MEELRLAGKNGSESMRAMGQANFLRLGIWLVLWGVCFTVICGPVVASFQTYCDMTSIRQFQSKLLMCLIWTLFLTLLWWWIANNSCRLTLGARLRNFFEQYSFIVSLAFIALEAAGVLIIYTFFGSAGIYAKNGWLHPVWSIYMFPVVFVAMMYSCPPVNIAKVILPVREERCRVTRVIIVVAALGVVIALTAIDLLS